MASRIYIRVRLNIEKPKWREQSTNTSYFPTANLLGSKKAEDHLSCIAKFPKYKDSWVECYSALEDLCYESPRIFDKESDPIFIDLSYKHQFSTKVKSKLDNASLVAKTFQAFLYQAAFPKQSPCAKLSWKNPLFRRRN